MGESKVTIGSIIGTIFLMILVMGIFGPLAIGMGVYSGASGNPAAQAYLVSEFGSNGITALGNSSVNNYLLPYAQQSANASTSAIGNLAQSSGYAFIFGGIGEFFGALANFPKFLYVMLIMSFGYNQLGKLIPFDIAGLLVVCILSYLSIILVLKLISLFSKPSGSWENT